MLFLVLQKAVDGERKVHLSAAVAGNNTYATNVKYHLSWWTQDAQCPLHLLSVSVEAGNEYQKSSSHVLVDVSPMMAPISAWPTVLYLHTFYRPGKRQCMQSTVHPQDSEGEYHHTYPHSSFHESPVSSWGLPCVFHSCPRSCHRCSSRKCWKQQVKAVWNSFIQG